jgi:hypothetical protein
MQKEEIIMVSLDAKGIEHEWPSFLESFSRLGALIPAPAAPVSPEEPG